jgi:hypothetical protein
MTNAPESINLTAGELQTFAAARDAVAHLTKTFEQWVIIARAVEIARTRADQWGSRSAFERILNQQGIAHALGAEWSSQKTTAYKLLKILDHLPEIEAWRAELPREKQFAWQAPTTIFKHYPPFKADKPERKPKPKADAEAIDEITADLRKAADDIVTKTSAGAQAFDLSPEMIEESARNFIAIYGEERCAQFGAILAAPIIEGYQDDIEKLEGKVTRLEAQLVIARESSKQGRPRKATASVNPELRPLQDGPAPEAAAAPPSARPRVRRRRHGAAG